MEEEKKQNKKNQDNCPLCDVSEETIKKLKETAKQKEAEKENRK